MTKTFWGRHGLHHQLFPKRNPAYVGEDRVHPCVPSLVLAWPARDLIHSVWANYSSIIQGPPKRNHSKNDLILRLNRWWVQQNYKQTVYCICFLKAQVSVHYISHLCRCSLSHFCFRPLASIIDRIRRSGCNSYHLGWFSNDIYIPETRCIQIWSWWYQEFGHI